MNGKYRVFRFYYIRESPPSPMITYYDPQEKEHLGIIPFPTEPHPPGFEWWKKNGKFGKNEYLLEKAINTISSAGYRIISVIHLDNDPDKMVEEQITYQIVAEVM